MLLLDWAFVPNDAVLVLFGDRDGGQDGYGGEEGDEETHIWWVSDRISWYEQTIIWSGQYKSVLVL
jgi:hypothetical protein